VARLRLDSFPSKFPLNYVEKTLARLLPTPEQVATLNKDQLVKLWTRKSQLKAEILANPTKFFIPNEGGQREYMEFDAPEIRGRYFFAGNKTGKTTATCIRVAEHMIGRPLWGPPGSKRRFNHPVPCIGVYYTEDFASHEQTIIPTYLTWCLRSEILPNGLIRNQAGYISQIVHKNGSVLYFRTYDQGYEKAEGKDYHVAAFDEPPPRDTYTAVFRGLVALDGVLYIGATLLKEPWLYDELAHPFIRGFAADIYQNKWLAQRALEAFVSVLDETERLVRVEGKPLNLVGLIYPTFKDAEPFVVPHAIPWDVYRERPYPIIMGVDPHERKPLHIMWAWVLPDNSILWFDWALIVNESIDHVFKSLEQYDLKHDGRPVVCVMDPNRGPAVQLGGSSWQEEFEAHGYSVELGNDDLTFGHTKVRQVLNSGMMRWTDQCRGVAGPIYQMGRYSWDDWQKTKTSQRRTLKEAPQEKYKDFPDVIRYVAMADLSFDLLRNHNTVISLRDTNEVSLPYQRTPLAMTARPTMRRPRGYV